MIDYCAGNHTLLADPPSICFSRCLPRFARLLAGLLVAQPEEIQKVRAGTHRPEPTPHEMKPGPVLTGRGAVVRLVAAKAHKHLGGRLAAMVAANIGNIGRWMSLTRHLFARWV